MTLGLFAKGLGSRLISRKGTLGALQHVTSFGCLHSRICRMCTLAVTVTGLAVAHAANITHRDVKGAERSGDSGAFKV